jgi:hypothetical protein
MPGWHGRWPRIFLGSPSNGSRLGVEGFATALQSVAGRWAVGPADFAAQERTEPIPIGILHG